MCQYTKQVTNTICIDSLVVSGLTEVCAVPGSILAFERNVEKLQNIYIYYPHINTTGKIYILWHYILTFLEQGQPVG